MVPLKYKLFRSHPQDVCLFQIPPVLLLTFFPVNQLIFLNLMREKNQETQYNHKQMAVIDSIQQKTLSQSIYHCLLEALNEGLVKKGTGRRWEAGGRISTTPRRLP